MDEERVYKPGDTITLDNGKVLKAVLADTDGSRCYVCDDGVHKCYFSDKGNCPKCHSSEFYLIDYVGPRVIFVENG